MTDDNKANIDIPQAYRETAAGSLHALAKRRLREAEQLEALAKYAEALKPGSLEDEALWELAVGYRR